MKKIIMMCVILFLTFMTVGWNSKNVKINVKFLYKDNIYNVGILKGSKLSVDELDFISNKKDAVLLYGENFNMTYNNESLNEDISIMVCDYNGTEKLGKMYTLKEAYDKKYISKNDILNIYNNHTKSNKELILDKITELKILNDRLVGLKKRYNDAMLEDISIYGYYGNYNNSYVIRLIDVFNDYPAVMRELRIDDIVFQYSGPIFLVWINE